MTPLRDVKILIPEIPGEWTQRTRSGSTQVWNDPWHETGLPEVRLEPPQRGLFADRIDGAWYWVCGCEKCLGSGKLFNYSPCDSHDRCVTCNCSRAELTATPWGGCDGGWRCQPCQAIMGERRKSEALTAAAEKGHSEDDCFSTDEIICPYCASVQSADDRYESTDGLECDTCGGIFDLEVEWTPSYTTTKAKPDATDQS